MKTHAQLVLALIVGCSLGFRPGEALTQTSPPKVESGPGPYNVDLEAAPGKSEERSLPAPSGAFTVKGLLQFVAVQKDPKWAPMAGIELLGSRDSPSFGLIAFVMPKAPDKIEFASRDSRLEGLPDASFVRAPLSNLAIPFELHLDKSGVLQVSVAGRPGRAISVRPLEITRVTVHASGGHMRFANLEIAPSDK